MRSTPPFIASFRRILAGAVLLTAGFLALFPYGVAAEPPATPPAQFSPQESWSASYMGKSKLGYSHIVRSELTEEGRKLWQIRDESTMKLARLGTTVTLNVEAMSVDDSQGNLVRFETKVNLGPVPTVTRGKVVGNNLELEISTFGKTTTSTLPLGGAVGGFSAIEQSLERSPMKPGETRSLKTFIPVFNQVADVTLSAEKYEATLLLDGTLPKLLKINSKTVLPGQKPLLGTAWTNDKGERFKNHEQTMDEWTYRATRELATRESEGPPPDLIGMSIIKMDAGARRLHEAQQMKYRVTLKEGDPSTTFPSGLTQQVKRLGPHEGEITVNAIRPGDGHKRGEPSKPIDADIKPNNMIQSDDPTVIAMAKEGAAGETDPWRTALALERYVHGAIQLADFSQALASAAEVAKSRRGDCTEYAVLLAAVARARGIPARVAVGLVYAEPLGGFGYHMWTEVNIDGEWIPIDATLGRGGIGAGHLKLADSNFDSGSPTSFLPVYQVFGQLTIQSADAAK